VAARPDRIEIDRWCGEEGGEHGEKEAEPAGTWVVVAAKCIGHDYVRANCFRRLFAGRPYGRADGPRSGGRGGRGRGRRPGLRYSQGSRMFEAKPRAGSNPSPE